MDVRRIDPPVASPTASPRRGPATLAVQALHGTGGVGKTQLAAEYVYRRAAD